MDLTFVLNLFSKHMRIAQITVPSRDIYRFFTHIFGNKGRGAELS
jgi:hypothetical protein